MSLYRDYIKEREGYDIVESDKGFATYVCAAHECYIRDIYVSPTYRNSDEATKMVNEIVKIAKSQGCTVLLGSVAPNANNATSSLKFLLSYGSTLIKADSNLLLFSKDI